MTRSDYTYQVINGVLCIIDLNLGRMSVTNDIENVVNQIIKDEDLTDDIRIIYRDSDGLWDGWDHVSGKFIPMRQRKCNECMIKL